jgi:integrase
MGENMRRNRSKTRRAQQNTGIVELTKTQKMAGKTRIRTLPALAKRTKKRRAHKLPACLTIPEKDRFFKAIRAGKSARDLALFSLIYFHGLRASEPGRLMYSDYRPGSSLNLDRIRLTRLKGSVSCECAVVPAAALAVRGWIRRRGHEQGVLFPSRQRGPISRFRIFQLMRRYCAAAGIPREKWHPHTLKHSAAIHLLADRREGLVDVQRHLGHRDIKSTMRYLEALDDGFNEARARRLATWK